jgi:outer membrane receptor protein involved in Fe transport
MRRSSYTRTAVAGIAAALCALPPISAADTAGASDSASLQEVVVTANKLNAQRVLDIPASIQAISGDALQSAGDSTTGVYYGEAVISGSNADDGGGFESDIRLYDLDHVEVLRGPQGTLYGASSMSGTIRFIPKSPDLNALGGYLTMEGSETSHASGNYNINGALNLPIIDGMLALRLVGWKLYDSGYIDQIRVGEGVTGPVNLGTTAKPNYQNEPVQALGFLKGVNDDDVGGGRAISCSTCR